jgi:hypothetical protein
MIQFVQFIKGFWFDNHEAIKIFDRDDIIEAYEWLDIEDIESIFDDFVLESRE